MEKLIDTTNSRNNAAERIRKGDRQAVQRRRLWSLGVVVLSVVPFRFGGRLFYQAPAIVPKSFFAMLYS